MNLTLVDQETGLPGDEGASSDDDVGGFDGGSAVDVSAGPSVDASPPDLIGLVSAPEGSSGLPFVLTAPGSDSLSFDPVPPAAEDAGQSDAVDLPGGPSGSLIAIGRLAAIGWVPPDGSGFAYGELPPSTDVWYNPDDGTGDGGTDDGTDWTDDGSDDGSDWTDDGSDDGSDWTDDGSDDGSDWTDDGSDDGSDWTDDGSDDGSGVTDGSGDGDGMIVIDDGAFILIDWLPPIDWTDGSGCWLPDYGGTVDGDVTGEDDGSGVTAGDGTGGDTPVDDGTVEVVDSGDGSDAGIAAICVLYIPEHVIL